VRITLDIDDDVLRYVEAIVEEQGESVGVVLSELARRSLMQRDEPVVRNGIPLFPYRPGGQVVTLELVNELRDEE
jgi:hypothetical protein